MRNRNKGFTLIELLIVVAIIGILASIVLSHYVGVHDEARKNATQAQMKILDTALYRYQLNIGRFPTTEQGLQALVENPGDDDWSGPYLSSLYVPTDAWNNPFFYRCPPEKWVEYDLYSAGADEVEGTEDDIAEWNRLKKNSELG